MARRNPKITTGPTKQGHSPTTTQTTQVLALLTPYAGFLSADALALGFPAGASQPNHLGNGAAARAVVGNHAPRHTQRLCCCDQRQAIALHPCVKALRGGQARLFSAQGVEGIGSQIQPTGPVQARAPVVHLHLCEERRIVQRIHRDQKSVV